MKLAKVRGSGSVTLRGKSPNIWGGITVKIISLYARDMAAREIQGHLRLRELYAVASHPLTQRTAGTLRPRWISCPINVTAREVGRVLALKAHQTSARARYRG